MINWLFFIWKISHEDAFLGVEKNECAARVFLTPYEASEWDIFQIKNNQLIILFIIYVIHIITFNFIFIIYNLHYL